MAEGCIKLLLIWSDQKKEGKNIFIIFVFTYILNVEALGIVLPSVSMNILHLNKFFCLKYAFKY